MEPHGPGQEMFSNSGFVSITAVTCVTQALQQDTIQHSAGQESKAEGGRAVLSVTSFLIGLLDQGCPPWEPENPLQHHETTRRQASKKQPKRKLGIGTGERWKENEKPVFLGGDLSLMVSV